MKPKKSSPTTISSSFRRVIYIGYWISNDVVESLVNKWKEAGITHVIFTFLTQPDITRPISDQYSMTLAFTALTPSNQALLTSNFILGISYGGSAAMPVPYSQTFSHGAYYENNPEKLANDLVALSAGFKYIDLDIEYINDKFDECANFIGNVCKALKQYNVKISHAPQPPYFTSAFGNVYNTIYTDFKAYFDFFNIQYYNNGPSDTYDQIFGDESSTSVLKLIQAGISPSYIVVGKPVNASEGSAGGYVPLIPNLADMFKKAFADPKLEDWSTTGGVMIWFYNTGTDTTDNAQILAFMKALD